MKKLILICSMVIATALTGCSQNHFNIPTEDFASRVKVIGVAPIMIDRDSDIRHPQKDQLIALVTEANRKNEQQLVRKIKTTGNFYTAAFLDSESQGLFSNLFFRRESRDDAKIQYNKYFWKNDELKNYIQKNNLDAVMLIVVSGLTKKDKVSSFGLMTSLTSDYNHLIMTAQIVDTGGNILWEYPNFRQRSVGYDPMINLQYPDFLEAEANLTSVTNTKFRTIDGIRRILEKKSKDMLLRETQETEVYAKQFDEMISLLKYDADKVVTTPPEPPVKPADVKQPAPPAVQAAPVAPPVPRASAPAAETPVLPPAEEVVPAKGSTL